MSTSFALPNHDFDHAVELRPPPARMDTMHIICVGVVFIDTKISVSHFPEEDSKMSAEKITRQRGGNPANSLEVISDLLEHVPSELLDNGQPPSPLTKLHLITVLPEEQSFDSATVRDSIPKVKVHGLYRDGFQEASSSVIIQSKESDSRTIMSNLNGLVGMTSSEFLQMFDKIVNKLDEAKKEKIWVHFEGRCPEILLECIRALREKPFEICISVECENPNRNGLVPVAHAADIVFFSKLWVEKKTEFHDPLAFLEQAAKDPGYTRPSTTLICTWGSKGAAAVQRSDLSQALYPLDSSKKKPNASALHWEKAMCRAWEPEDSNYTAVVDTTGAGDTFIAGILFVLSNYPSLSLVRQLEFATQLASRKVYQVGFKGLGEPMLKKSNTQIKWKHIEEPRAG